MLYCYFSHALFCTEAIAAIRAAVSQAVNKQNELNHFVEYHIWRDYRYDWDQWRVLFDGSGAGGELVYQGGEDRTAIIYNPNLHGFLNNYSTLGQEEDRSEMIAYFLTENENNSFYRERLNLLNDFLSKMNNH